MRVIDNARDVLPYHFESSHRMGPPFVPEVAQHDDRRLAVHFCHRQPPRYWLVFVVPEVWRFVDGSSKPICDVETGVRANEFTQPLPITVIEVVDVEMQKP